MASVISDQDLQMFLGYFEEPEPGVPVGCTGWYHSAGKFPLQSPSQVFTFGPGVRSLVKDDVVGPFACRDEALSDLQECLGR
ncbi:MAG TPA: hypothetical protein PL151_19310 [Phycisphaerae bacterium]|nr:hypothetical protein [Phycisphaerae bacterium]HOJ73866.1 hypothetical protein [Phycisphaerae bacterium]HOM50807.1 hypothetical protein [Phycisphaerae bacterium]HON65557.1 hypothetical protein [Phycisphaerae bacterium]HPP26018.1 hypothetical protein [Phycisphaerae bacterium]